MYLAPLMALGWLLAFSRVGPLRRDHLLAGAVIVVAANALIALTAGEHDPEDGRQAQRCAVTTP